MRRYLLGIIACVCYVLDIQALLAGNFVPAHSSEQLGGLSSKHGPNNHLDSALYFELHRLLI